MSSPHERLDPPMAPVNGVLPPHAPLDGKGGHGQGSLVDYIHSRFRQVFGKPCSTLEKDSQWSIRSDPKAPAIFILVNGTYEKPAVWIFDPYAAENVWRISVTSSEEVDVAIGEIQRRTASAAIAWRSM